jgi:hypothetical protein
MHRLDAALYRERFPEAVVLAPAVCLKEVEEKVHVDSSLEHYFSATRPELDVHVLPVPFKPSGMIQEAVLSLPLPSSGRVLLVGDALQNLDVKTQPWPISAAARWYGVGGNESNMLHISRGFRAMFGAENLDKFLIQMREYSQANGVRIVSVCHGEVIQSPNMASKFEELRVRVKG